jgi:hypothetical protein
MSNKKIESNHFKVFRKLVPDFPDGEVWHEDCPDFWIHSVNGVIGVEHRLIHIPARQKTPLQAIEHQTDEIVFIAQEHAELRGMPPTSAVFHFRQFVSLKRKQRIEMARAITNIIHDKLPIIDSDEPFVQLVIRQPDLPEHLSSVHIIYSKGGKKHFWRCARSGWAMEDCIELFQKAIDEKEQLYSSYMDNCAECWLLMVAEVKPSSFINPNEKTLEHIYYSPFKRTYFLDLGQGRLYLLECNSRHRA